MPGTIEAIRLYSDGSQAAYDIVIAPDPVFRMPSWLGLASFPDGNADDPWGGIVPYMGHALGDVRGRDLIPVEPRLSNGRWRRTIGILGCHPDVPATEGGIIKPRSLWPAGIGNYAVFDHADPLPICMITVTGELTIDWFGGQPGHGDYSTGRLVLDVG